MFSDSVTQIFRMPCVMSLCMQAVDIPWSRLVFCPCHRRRWTQSHQDDPYILLLSSWYPPYHMSVSTAIQQSKQNRLIWTWKTFHVWAYMYFGYVRSWNSQGIFGDMLNSRVVKIKIRFFFFNLSGLRQNSIVNTLFFLIIGFHTWFWKLSVHDQRGDNP